MICIIRCKEREHLCVSNDYVITDYKNYYQLKDHLSFHDNRHDQTIFSLLSKKYGIPAFVDPSHFGDRDFRKWGHIVRYWNVSTILVHNRDKS